MSPDTAERWLNVFVIVLTILGLTIFLACAVFVVELLTT